MMATVTRTVVVPGSCHWLTKYNGENVLSIVVPSLLYIPLELVRRHRSSCASGMDRTLCPLYSDFISHHLKNLFNFKRILIKTKNWHIMPWFCMAISFLMLLKLCENYLIYILRLYCLTSMLVSVFLCHSMHRTQLFPSVFERRLTVYSKLVHNVMIPLVY